MENNSLAENKLLIMYAIKGLKVELTKDQLSDLLLSSIFMNYFDLQTYIDELEEADCIRTVTIRGSDTLHLTGTGEDMLVLFSDRMNPRKMKAVDECIERSMDKLIREATVSTSIEEGERGTYLVRLSAFEDEREIVGLTLSLPDKDSAESAMHSWRKDSSAIYGILYRLLIK